jgi:hypothetical protein
MGKGAGGFSLDQVLFQHVSTQNGVTLGAGTERGMRKNYFIPILF